MHLVFCKRIKYLGKEHKGYTLIELMIVVIIIGILIAVAVPVYNHAQDVAKENADKANIRILANAATQCYSETNTDIDWSSSGGGWSDYIQSWPVSPFGSKYTYSLKTNNGIITINEGSINEDPGTYTNPTKKKENTPQPSSK